MSQALSVRCAEATVEIIRSLVFVFQLNHFESFEYSALNKFHVGTREYHKLPKGLLIYIEPLKELFRKLNFFETDPR